MNIDFYFLKKIGEYFLFNKIGEYLGRNPNGKRGPHRMNNITSSMNNPSKRNTVNRFRNKDGF
jgi:hypothetical protein